MVDLEAVREISNSRAAWVGRAISMCDDDHSMAPVNELLLNVSTVHIFARNVSADWDSGEREVREV